MVVNRCNFLLLLNGNIIIKRDYDYNFHLSRDRNLILSQDFFKYA